MHKEAVDDGLKLLKEVLDAFDLLRQLINQVLLAMSVSQGAKEKEIAAAIHANIVERIRRQEAALNGQKKTEKEMKKICDEFTASLANMHIDVQKDIRSQDRSNDPNLKRRNESALQIAGKLDWNDPVLQIYQQIHREYYEKNSKTYLSKMPKLPLLYWI
jgi:hypothetical protein